MRQRRQIAAQPLHPPHQAFGRGKITPRRPPGAIGGDGAVGPVERGTIDFVGGEIAIFVGRAGHCLCQRDADRHVGGDIGQPGIARADKRGKARLGRGPIRRVKRSCRAQVAKEFEPGRAGDRRGGVAKFAADMRSERGQRVAFGSGHRLVRQKRGGKGGIGTGRHRAGRRRRDIAVAVGMGPVSIAQRSPGEKAVPQCAVIHHRRGIGGAVIRHGMQAAHQPHQVDPGIIARGQHRPADQIKIEPLRICRCDLPIGQRGIEIGTGAQRTGTAQQRECGQHPATANPCPPLHHRAAPPPYPLANRFRLGSLATACNAPVLPYTAAI